MKKTGMILAALFLSMALAGAAGAAPRLLDVQSKFYGTSMRILFVFDEPVSPAVVQDWEDKIIVINVPGFSSAAPGVRFPYQFQNFVVGSIGLANNGNSGYQLTISASRDFVLKQHVLSDRRLITLDVFALVKSLPAETYVKRGREYESRRQYQKALASYRKALNIRPRL